MKISAAVRLIDIPRCAGVDRRIRARRIERVVLKESTVGDNHRNEIHEGQRLSIDGHWEDKQGQEDQVHF